MKCLVCEGKNDLIFFNAILTKCFKKEGYPVHNKMDAIFDIFRSKMHPYHAGKFQCIIYCEGGKKKLFVNVVIPLIKEVFGKADPCRHELKHQFFVIIDADGTPSKNLNDNYCQVIKSVIKTEKISRFTCQRPKDDSCYDFFSCSDKRSRCYVKTSYIPTSLEERLLHKGIYHLKEKRDTIPRQLSDIDVHLALKKLAERFHLSVEELISLSVNEGWFNDEEWYQQICKSIDDYLRT